MSEKALKRYLKHRDKKERGQLTARKHLGLLEKKKDYKVRARDHRKKMERIRTLQQKAELRNPDEFHQAMQQKKVDANGNVVNTQRSNRLLSKVKKDKEVDTAFLKQKIQLRKKSIENQRAGLAALDRLDQTKRQHVILVDDEEELENWDAAEHFDTLPELVDRAHNRLKTSQLDETIIVNKTTPGMLKRADHAQRAAYEQVREDERVLREMSKDHDKLVLQRHLMNGGRYKKIVKKNIFGEEIKEKTRYQWKSERRR